MNNSLTVETVLSRRENYNLAFPFITELQQVNPYYKLIVSQYRVDTGPASKDFCKIGSRCVGNKWEDLYYLEKNFLERLAAAAGIQFPPAGRRRGKNGRKHMEGKCIRRIKAPEWE